MDPHARRPAEPAQALDQISSCALPLRKPSRESGFVLGSDSDEGGSLVPWRRTTPNGRLRHDRRWWRRPFAIALDMDCRRSAGTNRIDAGQQPECCSPPHRIMAIDGTKGLLDLCKSARCVQLCKLIWTRRIVTGLVLRTEHWCAREPRPEGGRGASLRTLLA